MKIGQWMLVGLVLGMAADGQEQSKQLRWLDGQGQTVRLAQYQGKVVVLNFWATWCIPCRQEMPVLAEMEHKYSQKGLAVLGASVDDEKTQPQIQTFADNHHVPFPLLRGASSEQMQSLGLGESIPATAFFDADGQLVARVLGELNRSELEHRLEWMLGKHHGKEPAAFVNGFAKKPRQDSAPSIFTH
ncbi:MAG: TlpA family protein disulfide reductase [Acidobacteria bacterium]|nr:TlpA family protein disulfide reductase [Acidobacteriota bacterium]